MESSQSDLVLWKDHGVGIVKCNVDDVVGKILNFMLAVKYSEVVGVNIFVISFHTFTMS